MCPNGRQIFFLPLSHQYVGMVAQSCPTLCDPIDCSLPGGSRIHSIYTYIHTIPIQHIHIQVYYIHTHLYTYTVYIQYDKAVYYRLAYLTSMQCACMQSTFRRVQLFVAPWTVARQAPPSMGILQARTLEWVAMPSFGLYTVHHVKCWAR